MDEIVSLVVANGLFAVLFCGLLVYELRDSRSRERKYTQTIRALTDKLDAVKTVGSDVARVVSGVDGLTLDVAAIRADVAEVKSATVARCGKPSRSGGRECAKTTV
ncbi:MAG: hypothetical protein K2L54_00470 [Clostridiales bacterium]|nr:hypothetical protein [Clostridiales bacterium]